MEDGKIMRTGKGMEKKNSQKEIWTNDKTI